MVSSVVTITSIDLLVIYLPALGAERHIGSDHIGLLLTVRSLASLVSRVNSSTRSTLVLTLSITSPTRPPPQRGRTRSNNDDAFFAAELNIGTDVFSNFDTVTGRGSIRAAMRFKILTPLSFSSKCLRLSSPQRPMILSMLLAFASPVAA